MIRGLAIETSGRLGSVAITADGVVIGQDAFAHGLQHAAEMVPRIDALVKQAGWKPLDIVELYVSVGPGSFTGLRIGITLAKTLAMVSGAKVVAVPSVQVLARNAPTEAKEVIVVLDAKREQIYTSRLQSRGEDWVEVEPAHLDSMTAILSRSGRPVWLIGEGIPYHQKFVPIDDPGVILTDAEHWRARAAVVATIGHAMARQGRFTDPQMLTPIYIRRPEAEEKFEQRSSR